MQPHSFVGLLELSPVLVGGDGTRSDGEHTSGGVAWLPHRAQVANCSGHNEEVGSVLCEVDGVGLHLLAGGGNIRGSLGACGLNRKHVKDDSEDVPVELEELCTLGHGSSITTEHLVLGQVRNIVAEDVSEVAKDTEHLDQGLHVEAGGQLGDECLQLAHITDPLGQAHNGAALSDRLGEGVVDLRLILGGSVHCEDLDDTGESLVELITTIGLTQQLDKLVKIGHFIPVCDIW